MFTTGSRPLLLARRARRTWAELDYAQRRLLEIRSGQPLGTIAPRPTVTAADLERLYHYGTPLRLR
ncbi:MAG: hypothetical protein WBQ18_08595 [Solirubrobacteraceae bacterium]